MIKNCLLCNQRVRTMELDNGLCKCCVDILEFGYPSFPAYRLEEKREKVKEDKVLILIS